MICFNFGRLKKLNLRLFYLSLHFCAYTILFQFGRIWTNLNETFWPYSCGIEMIFFNDEKLKKWNLRLLKSSMRIYAYLCASMRVLGYPSGMTIPEKVFHLINSYVKKLKLTAIQFKRIWRRKIVVFFVQSWIFPLKRIFSVILWSVEGLGMVLKSVAKFMNVIFVELSKNLLYTFWLNT